MHNDINNAAELKSMIVLMERKQSEDLPILKQEAVDLLEGFKPVSIVKTMLSQLTQAPDFKNDVLNTIIGMTAGVASRRAVTGRHPGGLMDLVGTFLQMGVTSLVTRNSDGISTFVIDTMNKWFGKEPDKLE